MGERAVKHAEHPASRIGRIMANNRALKLAAERAGLRVSEYLASVGLTRDEFVKEGKRPANYGAEKKAVAR